MTNSIPLNGLQNVVNSILELYVHKESHAFDHKALRRLLSTQIKTGFPQDINKVGRDELIDMRDADTSKFASWINARTSSPINWIESDTVSKVFEDDIRGAAWMALKHYRTQNEVPSATQVWRDLLKEGKHGDVPLSKGAAKQLADEGHLKKTIVEHNPPMTIVARVIEEELNSPEEIREYLSTCRVMRVTAEENARIDALGYKTTVPENGDDRWELAEIEEAKE